jgi:hypothetical protein
MMREAPIGRSLTISGVRSHILSRSIIFTSTVLLTCEPLRSFVDLENTDYVGVPSPYFGTTASASLFFQDHTLPNQNFFKPFIAQVRLSDGTLPEQAVQYDTNLFLGSKLASRLAADILDHFFGVRHSHSETPLRLLKSSRSVS